MNSAADSPLDVYSRAVIRLREAYYDAFRRKRWLQIVLGLAGAVAGVSFIEYRRHGAPWEWALPVAALVAAWASRELRRVALESRRAYRLRGYYETGMARLTRDWDALPTGEEYAEPGHAYAAGLDLFGHCSLYQLLCSARTRAGKDTLAKWMKEPASIEEARARNEAARELWACSDLREAIASAGQAASADFRIETFREWVNSAPAGFPAWAPWLAIPLALAVIGMLLAAWILQAPQLLATPYFAAALGGEAGFSFLFLHRGLATLEWLKVPSVELPVLLEVVRCIEQRRFSAPKLVHLAERFRLGNCSAGRELGRLMRLVSLLRLREQPMFTLVSYILLWGTQFAMAIDRWRLKHGARLLEWLAAVGEFEALISIATYACEHPNDPFAESPRTGRSWRRAGLGILFSMRRSASATISLSTAAAAFW